MPPGLVHFPAARRYTFRLPSPPLLAHSDYTSHRPAAPCDALAFVDCFIFGDAGTTKPRKDPHKHKDNPKLYGGKRLQQRPPGGWPKRVCACGGGDPPCSSLRRAQGIWAAGFGSRAGFECNSGAIGEMPQPDDNIATTSPSSRCSTKWPVGGSR